MNGIANTQTSSLDEVCVGIDLNSKLINQAFYHLKKY